MWTCCDQRSVSKLHESNLNWSSRWNDGGSNTSQAVGPMRPYKVFNGILWEWLGVGREQVQIQCIDFFLPNVWLLSKQHDKRTNFRHHRINGEAVVFCLILGFYTMSFYTMPVFHLPPYYQQAIHYSIFTNTRYPFHSTSPCKRMLPSLILPAAIML